MRLPEQINCDSRVTWPIQHHLFACKLLDTLLTKMELSACFAALLIIGVTANGAPKRGLGANDDVLITVSAM